MRQLHLDALVSLETVADEDRLRRDLIQAEAGGVQLLHLVQQLHCNVTDLVLGKRTFEVGEHVEIPSALAQKFRTQVVHAVVPLVVVIEEHWCLQLLQALKIALQTLVDDEIVCVY